MKPDLFPKPPRKAPRVLMHVIDMASDTRLLMRCKCGHEESVKCIPFDERPYAGRKEPGEITVTEAKRGVPCPICNKGEA